MTLIIVFIFRVSTASTCLRTTDRRKVRSWLRQSTTKVESTQATCSMGGVTDLVRGSMKTRLDDTKVFGAMTTFASERVASNSTMELSK